ncbi:MAG: DUF547 domain-containing protein [Planctomycetota bacterium]
MRKQWTMAVVASVAVFGACAEADTQRPSTDTFAAAEEGGTMVEAVAFSEALAGYDTLLQTHVDADGFVDYRALAAEPEPLDAYVAALAKPGMLPPSEQREMRLAALINAYNAFTLKLILDHYDDGRLGSITDLHGGKPWDQKIWPLDGRTVSLNQIEHDMIRPVFDEPRIHWALVCAAYSCPPLRAEAYTAEDLETQLASQEDYVLNFDHPRYAVQQGGKLKLTKLFDWYGQDFGQDWKAYASERLDVKVGSGVGFVNYDWRLNSKENK